MIDFHPPVHIFNHPALALIRDRLAAFRLGQRDHDALFPKSDWREYRLKLAEAIERLR